MRYSMLLFLAIIGIACAGGNHSTAVTPVAAAADDIQTQSPDTTIQSFTAVEGADLMARLDAAQTRARSRQTPYWSAYTFDVRPGVAVDPAIREFHGTMNTMGDTTVFVGTTSAGVTVETRSLAIFLLRDPASKQITRMEVYNLERKREYSGYPVYWLGRANNEESLNYLRAIAAAAPLDMLSERAVLGIALHDDSRVGGMLKNFVTTSPNQRIRSTSVYWLGQVGGEQIFLATLVRNDNEDKKIRRAAAHAIGQSRDRGTVTTLQGLYDGVKDAEIRRSVISAAGNAVDQQPAYAFLLAIGKNDADWESRRTAVRQLGRFQREDAAEELMKIYNNDANIEVKRAALRSLAETKNPRGQARLLEISRTESNPELRKTAIRVLSERGEAAVDDLLKLYESEQVSDVKRTILQTLSEIKSTRVEDKLFEVAKSNDALDVRRQAIRLLGERVSKRSFEFLSATAQSTDGNAEVQVQAVRAISERRSEESVPILIKIARTHPNQMVRKQAIRSLGESGDPRAVDFFKEVLAK
ncbi:MAG TPA: HEAT repeat domain-containing protein [Pyrinomonadaceae bacterium]|jgi:HEAT repeat protein|nr:HEAT repeat domain-containing protein [Pyrinomonadaceae bacterium]